jgi:hypothetical protein
VNLPPMGRQKSSNEPQTLPVPRAEMIPVARTAEVGDLVLELMSKGVPPEKAAEITVRAAAKGAAITVAHAMVEAIAPSPTALLNREIFDLQVRQRRRSGPTSFDKHDQPLIEQMHQLVKSGEVVSPSGRPGILLDLSEGDSPRTLYSVRERNREAVVVGGTLAPRRHLYPRSSPCLPFFGSAPAEHSSVPAA